MRALSGYLASMLRRHIARLSDAFARVPLVLLLVQVNVTWDF